MKLAVASDEISRDFDTAAEIGTSWGLNAYELRGLCTGRVPKVDKTEIERIALASEAFVAHAAGAAPKRVIVVPGRLVNVVV